MPKQSIRAMKHSLRGAVGLGMTLAVCALGTSAAHADTRSDAPGCSSVTEFGPIGKIIVDGQVAASVRGYKGCGRTYSMLWVETDWASTHVSYGLYASVQDPATGYSIGATMTNSGNPTRKLWSLGDTGQHQLAFGGIDGPFNCGGSNGATVSAASVTYLTPACQSS